MGASERIRNFGIGTDIESIDRFRKLSHAEDSSFLNKIFTKNELEYCFSKGGAASHLAVRYAGKEAIVKALTGVGKPNLNYKDIEIFNEENGAPGVRINNAGPDLRIYLSLSHCEDRAIAFAVVMEVDRCEED